MLIRMSCALLGGALLLLALTGCDPAEFPGPVALRLQDQTLEIAVCETASLGRVDVSELGTDEQNWRTILMASGLAPVDAGTTFKANDLPAGLAAEESTALVGDDSDIEVAVSGTRDAEDVYWENSTDFATLERAGDRWVRSDGTIAEEPCVLASK